jgi:hypothetical protein
MLSVPLVTFVVGLRWIVQLPVPLLSVIWESVIAVTVPLSCTVCPNAAFAVSSSAAVMAITFLIFMPLIECPTKSYGQAFSLGASYCLPVSTATNIHAT